MNNPNPNYNYSNSKYAYEPLRRGYGYGPQGQVYNDGIRGKMSEYGNYRGTNGTLRETAQMPERYRNGGTKRKGTKRKGTKRKGTRRKGTRRR
jgi:hypothetical protein